MFIPAHESQLVASFPLSPNFWETHFVVPDEEFVEKSRQTMEYVLSQRYVNDNRTIDQVKMSCLLGISVEFALARFCGCYMSKRGWIYDVILPDGRGIEVKRIMFNRSGTPEFYNRQFQTLEKNQHEVPFLVLGTSTFLDRDNLFKVQLKVLTTPRVLFEYSKESKFDPEKSILKTVVCPKNLLMMSPDMVLKTEKKSEKYSVSY